MGAARTGRSSVVVGGREFLWSFHDNTGQLRIVSADKRFVVYYDFGWRAGGESASATVIGRECPAVREAARPVRVTLPPFEHCYSFKGTVKRVIEWCYADSATAV